MFLISIVFILLSFWEPVNHAATISQNLYLSIFEWIILTLFLLDFFLDTIHRCFSFRQRIINYKYLCKFVSLVALLLDAIMYYNAMYKEKKALRFARAFRAI